MVDMAYFNNIKVLIHLQVRYRNLTWQLAQREIADRYVGQAFGVAWTVFHPLFMMGLYVFIFAHVLEQKTSIAHNNFSDYTAYILSGLTAWLSVQESLVKSCTLITSNSSLVKQVVFPLEVLPVKSVLVSLLPQVISLLVIIIYLLYSFHHLYLTILLLPLLIFTQLIAMIGITFIMSSLGVYFRDLKDLMQLFVTIGIYITPIFYTTNSVPNIFKMIIYANPFSHLIWCYQDLLFYGEIQHPWSWLFVFIGSLLSFVFGYSFFRQIKPYFGNML